LFSDKAYNHASAKRVVIGFDKKEKKRINKKTTNNKQHKTTQNYSKYDKII